MNRRRARGERGAALVIAGVVMTGLLLTVGIAVDLGQLAVEQRRAQGAADAAALAAVQDVASGVATGDPRLTAAAYAGRNLGGGPLPPLAGCTDGVCFGTADGWRLAVTWPYSLPSEPLDPQRTVRTVACRDLASSFGALVGISRFQVCASAVATVELTSAPGVLPGIMALGLPRDERAGRRGTRKAFDNKGRVTVLNGSVQVNSRHTREAARLAKRSQTTASAIDVVGGVRVHRRATVEATVRDRTGQAVPDPLAGLVPPSYRSAPDVKLETGKLTLLPGTYGKIEVKKNGRLTLQGPGVFVLGGLVVEEQNASVTSVSAFVYSAGQISVDKGATLQLQAMTATQARAAGVPDYAGIALMMARCGTKELGTAACDDPGKQKGPRLRVRGKNKAGKTSALAVEGAIYAPSSTLELKGESEAFDERFDEEDDEDLEPDDTGCEASDGEDPTADDGCPEAEEPEFAADLQRTLIVTGRLRVGRKAALTIDTAWPERALAGGMGPTLVR